MRTTSVALLILLSACGCRQNYIQAELQPYVTGFLNLSFTERVSESITGLGLTVQFGDPATLSGNPAAVGLCQTDPFGRTVTVDQTRWPTFTSNQQRALVYHELGHCVLGRTHRADMIAGTSCPQSIMNPTLDAEYCLRLFGEEYNYELFHEGAMIEGPVLDSSVFYMPRALTIPMRFD